MHFLGCFPPPLRFLGTNVGGIFEANFLAAPPFVAVVIGVVLWNYEAINMKFSTFISVVKCRGPNVVVVTNGCVCAMPRLDSARSQFWF